MHRFLQLHLLTSYPPSNLNRDDLSRPKSAIVGGVKRLRISSQSLKRAWRSSELFAQTLEGHVGVRTKEMGRKIYRDLTARGVAEKDAKEWAKAIAGRFGALKKTTDKLAELDIEQLAHFSPEEQAAIDSLVQTLAAQGSAPTEEQLKLLRHEHRAADIALFGRMLASSPDFNTEAAAQIAHAITVHKVQEEDDFFTAVDDLNRANMGAGHMGESGFGAGVFYLYACINRELLRDNLQGDDGLTKKTLAAILEAMCKIAPAGKQNSYASRAYASYALAEKGDQQPRSLSLAFVDPVVGPDFINQAIGRLNDRMEKLDKVYGDCAAARYAFNAEQGEGSLNDLIRFATE
ncbi:type I-E CRISPR-associated protein Cas7/Cse4/CasC [Methylocaldum sp. RMAD-M]|jgi:CRISPR system Cascade subunit CasC|uniref:type I-E CRISPR-associated protein Cas7/Cse4/CasC n=1 Tax=unclassified Methylocaldum TaxID=2622260 RepID=UPI000A31F9AD|nr:type I-E CRISPR-associated protein Cas7/Cse4/CasC [Methylocaldum sp. RMAD-M]MBP1148344.1 CRISPR system Cascade subunit CasC [Methylocaldum sp. RMAD-M]